MDNEKKFLEAGCWYTYSDTLYNTYVFCFTGKFGESTQEGFKSTRITHLKDYKDFKWVEDIDLFLENSRRCTLIKNTYIIEQLFKNKFEVLGFKDGDTVNSLYFLSRNFKYNSKNISLNKDLNVIIDSNTGTILHVPRTSSFALTGLNDSVNGRTITKTTEVVIDKDALDTQLRLQELAKKKENGSK